MAELLADLEKRHPSVGAVRSIGLFGVIELDSRPHDARADGAVQRHLSGDGRPRQVLPPGRALYVRAVELRSSRIRR